MIYNLYIQINEKPHDTNSESYNKNYDNVIDDKNFNYKEIDNIIFAPQIIFFSFKKNKKL